MLQRTGFDFTGSCGSLLLGFDHVPTVTLKHLTTIGTGRWRDDIRPVSMWAGTMNDGQDSNEPIELETYAGGWGIVRTDEGWFPATEIGISPLQLTFDVFPYYQISPGALDRKIVQRAAALLSNSELWNRADDRNCPTRATTLSIYCAMQKATIEVSGGFAHRRPALQVVRDIINERTAKQHYQHLLMDYNNDSKVGLSDVQDVFKTALVQMANVKWLQANGFVRRFNNGFEPG